MSKRAIPQATRRAVARRAGATGPGKWPALCHYCDAPGAIHWMTKSWVCFKDLELDHMTSEFMGGDGSPENIVLACRPCNRRKGWRH